MQAGWLLNKETQKQKHITTEEAKIAIILTLAA
jgi:hypothetical protein